MLFQKFRKYFDEFYYALDKKYIDASKHTEEEKNGHQIIINANTLKNQKGISIVLKF